MSSTPMTTLDPLTVKQWEMTGWVNVGQKTALGRMFERGSVYFPEEFLGKETKGDELTYDYIGRMTGHPIGEGGTLDGNEKALDLGNMTIAINETRDAILIPSSGIEPQRTKVNMEKAAKTVLPNRAAELVDTGVFQQLAGVNPTSFTMNGVTYDSAARKLHVQGHNTIIAPTSDRIVRPANAATDQALTSADKLTLQILDYAIEKNEVSDQPIEPFDDGTFDFYCHPYSITDLKHDAGSSIQWNEIELARIMGGEKNGFDDEKFGNKLPILGKYGAINIIRAPRVAFGATDNTGAVITTVRRNLLVGKNALTFASPYGGRPSDNDVPMKIIDQLKDYKKYKGLGFELVYGLKKNTPSNGQDIGTMVLSAYSASHTA